jgi:hypothetical protein
MKKHLKNIVVVFFAFMVITATGGFSIYHHICHCAGEMSASIFLEATCDNNQSASGSECCNLAEEHSCCMEKRPVETKHACNDEDCCQTSMQFLKIYDSFQPEQEKLSLKPVFSASVMFFIDAAEDILTIPFYHIFSSDLPPPDSGREIILALHQLKLAHPKV